MNLILRIYRGIMLPVEVDRRAVAALVPVMRMHPGFRRFTTADLGRGRFCTLAHYTDRAAADTVSASAPAAVRSVMGGLVPEPPELRFCQVMRFVRTQGRVRQLVLHSYEACPDAREMDLRAGELLLPMLCAQPGFRGYTTLDCGAGRITTATLFDSADDAEDATAQVHRLVATDFADLLPIRPDVLTGRVLSESVAQTPALAQASQATASMPV